MQILLVSRKYNISITTHGNKLPSLLFCVVEYNSMNLYDFNLI